MNKAKGKYHKQQLKQSSFLIKKGAEKSNSYSIPFLEKFSDKKSKIGKNGIIQLLKNLTTQQNNGLQNKPVLKNKKQVSQKSQNHLIKSQKEQSQKQKFIKKFNNLKEPDYLLLNKQRSNMRMLKSQKQVKNLIAQNKEYKIPHISRTQAHGAQSMQQKAYKDRRVNFTGEQSRKLSKPKGLSRNSHRTGQASQLYIKKKVKTELSNIPQHNQFTQKQHNQSNNTETNKELNSKKFSWGNPTSRIVSQPLLTKNSVSPVGSYRQRNLSPQDSDKQKPIMPHKIKSQSSIAGNKLNVLAYQLDKDALRHYKYLQRFEINVKKTQRLLTNRDNKHKYQGSHHSHRDSNKQQSSRNKQ